VSPLVPAIRDTFPFGRQIQRLEDRIVTNTIRRIAAGALVVSTTAAALAQNAEPIPAALARMADTERAFAKRALDTSVREAFIEFFADESVSFEPPGPGPARERLRARPAQPPRPGFQLLWEPRYGDVAASGDLGYLTGPVENVIPGRPSRYGNYFSIWKRQANGEFRVIIDLGTDLPQPAVFAPGVARASGVAAWMGTDAPGVAEASLGAADKALAASLAAGAADAFQRVLHAEPYFLRTGFMPMRTRDAAVAWLRANVKSWTAQPMKAETAMSGDLGYTWGRMTLTTVPGRSIEGYYVHVWTRKADGSWQIVASVTTPPPPEP
jgi:ketosteroid isomerase-like protein